jgi:hypothetical protein
MNHVKVRFVWVVGIDWFDSFAWLSGLGLGVGLGVRVRVRV